MEALAAIGLVSNILQLIECGYKIIEMGTELHESGQDATRSNTETAFVAQEMRELSLRLIKDLPSTGLTEEEEALCRLAQQCSLLSDRLLLLLDSLKLGDSRRKLNILKTVLRNLRKRKERDQLQASLDNYRKQLDIQIGYMSRSDLARKLEATLSSTKRSEQDILYLKDHVQKIQQKSTVDSANTASFFRALQGIVETPLRQNAILRSIQYPRMYERFDDVELAHRNTFEWLVQGPENHPSSEGQDNTNAEGNTARLARKYQKHREFVDWLEKGVNPSIDNAIDDDVPSTPHKGNIFHIAGKPGAGKSTLMKFLCENETTIKHLKTWAGAKRLICAKAFFWRLGDEEQKSLTGFRNCLLHQILTAAPELIPVAYPSVRESGYRDLVSYVSLTTQLDTMLKDGHIFENHKIVFFIDGLDEFKGLPTNLIRIIIRWAAWNPANLKICVSSREWNEFEVGFKDCPRFRIQDWTRDDIQIFVMDNFNQIGDLSTSVSTDDLNIIANVIVNKAEGVFLWVRVVLATIEQGVFNGDDFQDLQRKVSAFPAELRDLYQHLLDSIPDYDRQQAFETLMFACDTPGIHKSLLQYKFFGELAKDPHFATNMSTDSLSEAKLKSFSMNTSRQINGRCKGLLEIYSPDKEYYKGDEHVRLMHSTVLEFLRKQHVQDTINSYIGDFDLVERTCQSFLAVAKSLNTDNYYLSDGKQAWDDLAGKGSPFLSALARIMYSRFSPPRQTDEQFIERYLTFLRNVSQVAALKYGERIPSRVTIPLNGVFTFRRRPKGAWSWCEESILEVPLKYLITTMSARTLLVEYFDTGGLCNIGDILMDSKATKQIIGAVFSGISNSPESPRSLRMLELLFKAGMSAQVHVNITKLWDERQFPLWGWIWARLVFAETSWERVNWPGSKRDSSEGGQYKLIELFTRYGAGEDLYLIFGPCFEVTGINRLIVQVMCEFNGTPIGLTNPKGICVDYQLDIVRYARTKGGVLTLRDVLAYCFPYNYHHLYALLDGKSPTAPEINTSNPGIMPILFPAENRYFEGDDYYEADTRTRFDDKHKPKHCKQCIAHSEKCFTDFEARFKDGRLGSPYKMKQSSSYNGED